MCEEVHNCSSTGIATSHHSPPSHWSTQVENPANGKADHSCRCGKNSLGCLRPDAYGLLVGVRVIEEGGLLL